MRTLKKSKQRESADVKALQSVVAEIIDKVRLEGDLALRAYNDMFDDCPRTHLRVSREELDEAYALLTAQEHEDIKQAADNIRSFARAQKDTLLELREFSPSPGVVLGHRLIPVDACCCYVPGGNYALYSSALMLGIPAKVAGVPRVTACSPVMHGTERIHPKTLVALDVAGVDEIYAVGGAQAISAFSYGTDQIAPVALIVGPGNAYVTEAKRQCFGQVGIDFIAGPSEVLIIADRDANPEIIAADILAQSEHDPLAKGILITLDRQLGDAVTAEVERQLETLETAEIARQSWADYGEILLADNLDEAIRFANLYAPEHLELNLKEWEYVAERLTNYGSLFIGEGTAEVFGDYASGTNHTLPTLRAARYTGGVWVGTFLKTCTYQKLTPEASKRMAPLVGRLARGEGLIAHAKAAELRGE